MLGISVKSSTACSIFRHLGVEFGVQVSPRRSRRFYRMDNETLTITDNRTGQTYTIPIYRGTVRAMDLRQIKTAPTDFGLMTYDPAFMNTASCQSAITYLDGDN